MGNLALNFIAAHQQLVQGVVLGAVLSNPGACALLFFTLITKIPGVGPWIGKNPDKAKAWGDAFDKKIDELVDKYAADTNKNSAPPPPPAA